MEEKNKGTQDRSRDNSFKKRVIELNSTPNWIASTLLLVSFLLVTLSSCYKKSSLYYVSLNDSLQSAIKSYVAENRINVNSRVITTDWMVNPYRTDIYISNTFRQFQDDQAYVPTYFSTVSDSIVVFVYTGAEAGVVRNTKVIQVEVEALLSEKGITLKPYDRTVDHVKTWLYSSCGEKGMLIRNPSTKDLYYIPCRTVIEPMVE